ncbi:MAG: O-antigen ligase family protein [Bacteroidota bacterium]
MAFILPFLMFPLERYLRVDIPFGALIHLTLFITFLSILLNKVIAKNLSFNFLNSSITYAFILFFVYNLIQVFNPNVSDISGWLFTLRGIVALFCSYVLGAYFGDKPVFINQFVKLWLTMSCIAALYACYQEWFGLADFERNWVNADTLRFNRIFVQGRYRKFSLLSDPTAFGILMAASAFFSIIMAIKPQKSTSRLIYLAASVSMLLAMGYSGTRTAYAMLPAGFILFALMTLTNSRTLGISAFGAVVVISVLFGPIYGSATINRIRSTFDLNDQSLGIRDINRQSIQPYIYEHAFGGGPMTTGDAGLKYNPEHPLAGFPPDNGYLKLALETGWIGLIIYFIFLFTALKEAIIGYYRSSGTLQKNYLLGFSTFIFAISIALYAQTVTAQIPMSLVFWPALGLVSRLKQLNI